VTDLLTDHLQKHFPKIDAIVGKCLTLLFFCKYFSKWAVPENIDTPQKGSDWNFLGVG